MTNPLSPELLSQFMALLSQLSPENLSCDGQLTRAQIKRRHMALAREWEALEKQVGRRVNQDEIYKQEFDAAAEDELAAREECNARDMSIEFANRYSDN